MTTRTQDYTLLGQSLFLSTGITTVFCNAVGSLGHGHSCFIGQDSWDRDLHDMKEPCDAGPYHGVSPGIFRQNDPKRGWLDKDEQAMVIVDIDPIYASPSQPRQQVHPQSLSLVAHLPIIESELPNCPGRRSEVKKLWNNVGHFWEMFQNKQKTTMKSNNFQDLEFNTSLLNGDEIKKIIELLECLTDIKDKDEQKNTWLKERLVSFREYHKSHPQMLPPPVAMDWLWVDMGESIYPEIEVPPYQSFSDGGSREPVEGD